MAPTSARKESTAMRSYREDSRYFVKIPQLVRKNCSGRGVFWSKFRKLVEVMRRRKEVRNSETLKISTLERHSTPSDYPDPTQVVSTQRSRKIALSNSQGFTQFS